MWERLIVKKILEINGIYTIFEGEYDGSYAFLGEVHDFWEMVYIIDGSVCVCADEHVYHMEKNEIIFHRPMQLHKFNIENNKAAHMFIISLDISGEYAPRLENKVCRLTPGQASQLMGFMQYLGQSSHTYDSSGSFKSRSFLPAFSNPVVAQIAQNTLENFLISVCSNNNNVCILNNDTEAITYSAAVRYMNTNLQGWPSAAEIARSCGVSLTYLKYVFSKYAGRGIHKYFLSLKMQTAINLLTDGNSVSQTASILNFSSQNYFSVVFKREIGVTPTEYISRKKYTPSKLSVI